MKILLCFVEPRFGFDVGFRLSSRILVTTVKIFPASRVMSGDENKTICLVVLRGNRKNCKHFHEFIGVCAGVMSRLWLY
jgi:hypothetical protein